MRSQLAIMIFFLLSLNSFSQRKLTVVADKPIASVASTMWGVFFEDINFGADGGLYAELVKNRSFEFPTAMMGWRESRVNYQKGRFLIINKSDNSANARFARITINNSEGNYSLSNEGFRGIGVHREKRYDFSIMARTEKPTNIKIKVQLLNYSGKEIGSSTIENFSSDWKKYSASITTTDTAQKGKLNLIRLGLGFGFFSPISYLGKSQSLIGVNMLKIADHRPDMIAESFNGVSRLYHQGILKPHVDKVYRQDQLDQAQAHMEDRKSMGKVVVAWNNF